MFYWNPPREAFYIPFFDHPVFWYGILFVFGFIVGYWLVVPMFMAVLQDNKHVPGDLKKTCKQLTDQLTWYVIIGTIVGARLGHVFFYAWPFYQNHPSEIIKIWEGGLASHGGVLGILLAIFLFQKIAVKKYDSLCFLTLVDIVTVPAALTGCFIRLGNFVNQEILGTVTAVPWAVVFGNPADGSLPAPRHPVQLYEAIINFSIFILLFFLWRLPSVRRKPGFLTGLFFILVFGARTWIEAFKEPQSLMLEESWLSTGQLLSIPLVLLGIVLCCLACYRSKSLFSSQL